MLDRPSSPPKPVTDVWRPDLVALPRLTLPRRAFRIFMRGLTKLLTFLLLRVEVGGLENFPRQGPALVVINHLGDADAVLLIASVPFPIDGMGKIELNNHWLVGPIIRAYGVIWIHQGQPDRRALRAALDGLAEGRIIALAPEGRESVIGSLEEGTQGAAFLALRSGVPVVPVAIIGTENRRIYPNLKKLRRSSVTLTVGKPFFLQTPAHADRQKMLQEGTRQIMQSLASLLPEDYRGNYKLHL